jgi:hypothetical protein
VIDLMIDEMKSAFGQIGAPRPADARSVVIRHPGALAFLICAWPHWLVLRRAGRTTALLPESLRRTRMSALAEPAVDVPSDDRLARRNALVLAVTQALAGGNQSVLVATAGIVGTVLAPDKGLATLPLSVLVLGLWMGTVPVGVLARRYGRRTALQTGTIAGVLAGLICCAAVLQGSFLLFNIGAVFSGFYAAAHQSYRFAAADTASDAFRPKAISWVLLGGSPAPWSVRNSSSPRRTSGRPISSPRAISARPPSP